MKILKNITLFTGLLWIINGFITIGSIYLSYIGIVVNCIVGMLFILIGIYFYKRGKILLELLTKTSDSLPHKLRKKVITSEIILTAGILFIGFIILCAISSRVFREGFAVFG